MNARFVRNDPEIRKQRLLREALLDVQVLVPSAEVAGASDPEECCAPGAECPRPDTRVAGPDQPDRQREVMNANPRKTWNAGLGIDGAANIVVLGAGVLMALLAAATAGLEAPAAVQQAGRSHVTARVEVRSTIVADVVRRDAPLAQVPPAGLV